MTEGSAHTGSIMVVEDDQLLAELLTTRLAQRFKILYAATGEAALDMLKTELPDLILLDIMLPGIDGFDVLRELKADQKTMKVPVIILSNLGQPSDMEKGKELGAEKFVVKVTITPEEVAAMAGEVIAAHTQKQTA